MRVSASIIQLNARNVAQSEAPITPWVTYNGELMALDNVRRRDGVDVAGGRISLDTDRTLLIVRGTAIDVELMRDDRVVFGVPSPRS